ncbi:MAG: hypothetical protein LBF16_11355 [Pseudomonadales bacterium]|jgi:hypothetical protein|nr:hypothetical protein [Pseudomonadales bacterium]
MSLIARPLDDANDARSFAEKIISAISSTAKAINQIANAGANSVANLDLSLLKGLGNLPGDLLNFVVVAFKYGSGFRGLANALDVRTVEACNNLFELKRPASSVAIRALWLMRYQAIKDISVCRHSRSLS